MGQFSFYDRPKRCWVVVETVYCSPDELTGMREELAMFLEGLGLTAENGRVCLSPPPARWK